MLDHLKMRPSLLLGIVVILAGAWEVSAYPRLRVTLERQEKSVLCPNEAVECPDGETCCPTGTSDGFACCNMANAVCCADGIHCCDQGTFCDFKNLRCDSPTNEPPRRLTKLTSVTRVTERRLKDVCPDGRSCNSTSTCCLMNSRDYGCCPRPNGVCCKDHKHCCPEGYTCEDPIDKCIHSNAAMAVVPTTAKYNNNYGICPDKESECPDGNTCCLRAGKYGCCPLVNAMCCSDGNHCCPSGHTCNNSGESCMPLSKDENNKDALNSSPKVVAYTPTAVKPVGSIPLQSVNDVVKMVDTMAQSVNDVICPDQQSICPDGNTCCLEGGQYSCCPRANATCCSDGQHCCPSGYSCNGDFCEPCSDNLDNNFALTSIKSVSSSPESVKDVICPDQQSECPDNNTCCPRSVGDEKYGCCPMLNAVCCSDGLHCCPAGYSCACNACVELPVKPVSSIPLQSVNNVVCPDQQSICPDGNMCCPRGGQYGCCPLVGGTCCSDGQHCCPSGYSCRGNLCAPHSGGFVNNFASTSIKSVGSNPESVKSVTCPDEQSICPDNNTCCSMGDGKYGCCPEIDAVCCPGGLRCCPAWYSCDYNSCTRNFDKLLLNYK